jgi:hypothetical protein
LDQAVHGLVVGLKGGKMGADFNRILSGEDSFATRANDTARLSGAMGFRLSLEWRRASKFCNTKSTGGRFYREG